jgi:hypothetical protein
MPVAAPLLRGQWRGDQYEQTDLVLMLKGEKVSDPYVVGLRVESRSRKDIRTADFEDGKPLTFNFTAPILSVSLDTVNAVPSPLDFQVVGSELQIPPALIRSGELLRLTVLTDGPPKLDLNNPIANVDVRALDPVARPTRVGVFLFTVGVLIAIVTVVIAVVNQASNNGAILALFVALLGFMIALSGGVLIIASQLTTYLARRRVYRKLPPPRQET